MGINGKQIMVNVWGGQVPVILSYLERNKETWI